MLPKKNFVLITFDFDPAISKWEKSIIIYGPTTLPEDPTREYYPSVHPPITLFSQD